jgi:hypothetical protein
MAFNQAWSEIFRRGGPCVRPYDKYNFVIGFLFLRFPTSNS